MRKWRQTHPKGFWGSLIGFIIVVMVAGFSYWQWHTQQQAVAKATQAIQLAQTNSDKLDAKVAKRWAKSGEYIKTSTTAEQLSALKTAGTKLVASVKPYRSHPTAANRKRLKQLDTAQTKRVANLQQLQKARVATVAVNALVMPEALHNTKIDDTAMIVEDTDEAAITEAQAKVAEVNSTLKETLTKILTTCQAQFKERKAWQAEIAKISKGGTLKDDVTLAQLKAFQAFLKKMTYPKLAEGDQTLVQGVQKAIDAMDTKKIPLAELQRRAFYAYSQGKDLKAAYLDKDKSHFDGDTYVAAIWGIYIAADGPSTHEMATLKITQTGDYKMTGRDEDRTGNIFKDIKSEQLDAMRKDITKGEEPKAKQLHEVFANARAFYNWVKDKRDLNDPRPTQFGGNTTAKFNDGQKQVTVAAVYDVKFNFKNHHGDAQTGRLVLAKDGTVYVGHSQDVLKADHNLTGELQQQRYSE